VADETYSLNDLARLSGINARTIRYYLTQGLIPRSGESGPGAHYTQGHLDRLLLIKRLQAEYLPNAEIRRRLAPLSDADVADLVGKTDDSKPTAPTTSALEYVRNLLAPASSARVEQPVLRRVAMTRSVAFEPPARAEEAPARLDEETAAPHAAMSMPTAPPSVEKQTPIPERSQWERLSLGENIELHIRRPLSRPEQRRVERLITIARQVLDEEKG
jgi:DNA-binding transcriptional MerR regulator